MTVVRGLFHVADPSIGGSVQFNVAVPGSVSRPKPGSPAVAFTDDDADGGMQKSEPSFGLEVLPPHGAWA